MWPPEFLTLAAAVLAEARAKRVMIATAESCTGGLVAGALTAIAGSSDVFDRGFVTYTNDAKIDDLDVLPDTIAEHGAVSEATVREMAEGALDYSNANISVAVTGIAGPGGGTAEKPVGLVHFAAAREGRETIAEVHRFGDIGRAEVRMASVVVALNLLRRQLA
jgi:nicotinamide-nucleotide amidase